MRSLIEYIGYILNIKIENELVALDITEVLKEIKDIADYRRFIRSNIDHVDAQYKTGFQKFIKLTDMYKAKINTIQIPERTANTFVSLLVTKINAIERILRTKLGDVEEIDYTKFIGDSKRIFTDKEVKCINTAFENKTELLYFQEKSMTKDKLYQVFVDEFVKSKLPAITANERKVLDFVGGWK